MYLDADLDPKQRILDRMHEAGIKVILGTPTYSVPTWLYREHPDILVTHLGTAGRLVDPYSPVYPSAGRPGAYGERQARHPPVARDRTGLTTSCWHS